jgi:hypothetical protein
MIEESRRLIMREFPNKPFKIDLEKLTKEQAQKLGSTLEDAGYTWGYERREPYNFFAIRFLLCEPSTKTCFNVDGVDYNKTSTFFHKKADRFFDLTYFVDFSPFTTPRPHAELIKQWADDDSLVFECRLATARDKSDTESRWVKVGSRPDWSEKYDYRIKPKTETKALYVKIGELESYSFKWFTADEVTDGWLKVEGSEKEFDE